MHTIIKNQKETSFSAQNNNTHPSKVSVKSVFLFPDSYMWVSSFAPLQQQQQQQITPVIIPTTTTTCVCWSGCEHKIHWLPPPPPPPALRRRKTLVALFPCAWFVTVTSGFLSFTSTLLWGNDYGLNPLGWLLHANGNTPVRGVIQNWKIATLGFCVLLRFNGVLGVDEKFK